MTPPSKRDQQDAPRRLFLLDGHSLAYRAFFALPPTLATSSGTVTNAVYGFTSMLIKLLAEERPDLIAVFFDSGAPTVRLAKDAEYKAGRAETPGDFRPQLGLIEEVLEALKIPVLRIADGNEADDAIGTLAMRAAEQGIDATIVTADRDFFQLVSPLITVMFNRKGISDIVRYDEAAVTERFGITPSQYLDFVALKGDTSDNIPGVPGVGDKTAAKLINQFGTVEELLANTDQLKGKQKENVEASAERLPLNKELAQIVTDVPLPVTPDDCVMGDWDAEEVRRLFTSLEFRSLFDRLQDVGHAAKPKVEVADLDLREVTADELPTTWSGGSPVGVRLDVDGIQVRGMAASAGGAQAAYAPLPSLTPVAGFVADDGAPKWIHDAKAFERVVRSQDARVGGVAFDTMLAGYLLDPAAATYPLDALCEAYLGADVLGLGGGRGRRPAVLRGGLARPGGRSRRGGPPGPRHGGEDRPAGLARAARGRGAPAGLGARAAWRPGAYASTSTTWDRWARASANGWPRSRPRSTRRRPRSSTSTRRPSCAPILYDRLGLQPGKKTPKGELSTDASVLEKLREENPIVDALLQWRELDKLNSTYLEALPKLVDPRDGRIHTTFNQAVAATGRLSSSNPNLQNIPVRSDLGRQIRQAFIPGEPGQVLLVLDYSQIELRILAHLSGDAGLREAFASGHDIHTETAARVFDLPLDAVDPLSRSRAKMVNYGLAYGMNAWGLAQRLDIPPDEAGEIMDAYFASFPAIREYLDRQVGHATVEGFTETILGRRRYIPELQAANPRLRDLGRRQALNAPIQGSASDVFKVAMIAVANVLEEHPELDAHMLLTVHDELVFEVPESTVEAAAELVQDRMEHAVDLEVPLQADVGWGPNWADAVPAGH